MVTDTDNKVYYVISDLHIGGANNSKKSSFSETGSVEDIDLRVTTVRTFDNEQITVPNIDLTTTAVTNPVAYDTLRQTVVFGIGHNDDINHAKAAILDEADAVEPILANPAPDIRVTELGDSAVGL